MAYLALKNAPAGNPQWLQLHTPVEYLGASKRGNQLTLPAVIEQEKLFYDYTLTPVRTYQRLNHALHKTAKQNR